MRRDIVVVGASAGGLEALKTVVGGLDASFPASVFVVLHLPSTFESQLPQVLDRISRLNVLPAEDEQVFLPGHIYVARTDHHLLLRPERRMRSMRGPRENHARPSIDVLFRSAARCYGARVIGVLLSGMLSDGSAGMQVIRLHGGINVVQSDAVFPSMPESAARCTPVDYIVPVARIPSLLEELVGQEVHAGPVAGDGIQSKMEDEMMETKQLSRVAECEEIGKTSVYTCPQCHGTLWELNDDNLLRFRCRVGHAFSAESLLELQSEHLEVALWSAMRSLEEKATLLRRMARDRRVARSESVTRRYEEDADRLESQADALHRLLTERPEK